MKFRSKERLKGHLSLIAIISVLFIIFLVFRLLPMELVVLMFVPLDFHQIYRCFKIL